MLNRILQFHLEHRWLVLIGLAGIVVAGVWAMLHIPIDAFPDLTNNQVTVVTEARSRSADGTLIGGSRPRLVAVQDIAIEADFTWPGGGRSIYFRDPAGNCLELAEPAIWKLT